VYHQHGADYVYFRPASLLHGPVQMWIRLSKHLLRELVCKKEGRFQISRHGEHPSRALVYLQSAVFARSLPFFRTPCHSEW
jgi:hypothetical protein